MSQTILIIEDDPSIANLQKDYLEIDNFDVTIETNGLAGKELALTTDYDLIILDIMLPGIDGFEICKAIRKEKLVPILIVSAKKEEIDKIRGFGLGADDYMIKPFSPSELVARVKAHITRYQKLTNLNHVTNEVIESHDLTINQLSRQVFVRNTEVIFTPKEFDLLVYLAEHPKRVFEKEQLFETIWGQDSLDTELATIVVHIKRIREKLKKAELNPIPIETIWGSGYRFNN
ncbi:response regulator transcription factor [Vagococcus fluvialis]|uniref:Response regulator transcription factor n=1 Tax=Vagococcus fluvialis TaxID=2738 RepID=A0A7X6DAS4_9ENTE|nr:response regulator transcription factor [Vagococcus fluvialis]NKC68956.1 response regulator transcription factor [Vagococcus fluvialis]